MVGTVQCFYITRDIPYRLLLVMGLRIGQVSRALYCELFVAMETQHA